MFFVTFLIRIKMKAIILGASCQDGYYLKQLLKEKNYEIIPITRNEFDMAYPTNIKNIIQKHKPDELYNLIGYGNMRNQDNLEMIWKVNALGIIAILEAVKQYSPKTRIFHCSSSTLYGSLYTKCNEDSPFAPDNFINISRLYAYRMCNIYRKSYNMYVSVGILFNHESFLRANYAIIKRMFNDEICNIDTNVHKDFGFAKDYVEAMYLSLQQEKSDNYIIGTGELHSLKEAALLMGKNNIIVPDAKEVFTCTADYTKAKTVLGWEPKTTFEEVINDIIEPKLFTPEIYNDTRGHLNEIFNINELPIKVKNIKHSLSHRGVFRGMHYQEQHPQAKLVTVISGEVYDALYNLSTHKLYYYTLNDENHNILYIPKGYAHGFLATKDNTHFVYACDDDRIKEDERTIYYKDLNIALPFEPTILSDNDSHSHKLEENINTTTTNTATTNTTTTNTTTTNTKINTISNINIPSTITNTNSNNTYKTAIITGVTGQDGRIMSEILIQKGYKVIGIARTSARDNITLNERVIIEECDLLEYDRICDIIIKYKPDEFYNFAAQSYVQYSFTNPQYTANVNGFAVCMILEAIRKYSPNTRFYQAGTSEMFGNSGKDVQGEETEFNPCSPYAAAKEYAHYITKLYREKYNIFAVEGILFNHESEYRSHRFITKRIVDAVQNNKILKVGNIFSKRDWGYAREYMNFVWKMLQKNSPKTYVIGTGETHSVKELIEAIYKEIKNIDIKWNDDYTRGYDSANDNILVITQTPENMRPDDLTYLCAKCNNEFKPKIYFNNLVKLLCKKYDYDTPIYMHLREGLVDALITYSAKFEFPYQKFILVIDGGIWLPDKIAYAIFKFCFDDIITYDEFIKQGHSRNELVDRHDTYVMHPNISREIMDYLGFDFAGKKWHMERQFNQDKWYYKEMLLKPSVPYSKNILEIIDKIKDKEYSLLHLRLIYNQNEFESFRNMDLVKITNWIEAHDKIVVTTETDIGYYIIEKAFKFGNKDVIYLKGVKTEEAYQTILVASYCSDILFPTAGRFGMLLAMFCHGKSDRYELRHPFTG